MSVQKGYHHAYDTHYHIVFPIKYRKALLSPDIAKAIREIAEGIETRYDIAFEQIGTDGDHIHILCSFPPTMSGGEVVGIFKSITAKQLFKRFPDLRKELWGGNLWTNAYYLATVSDRGNWKAVEQYVRKQGNTDVSHQLRLL